MSAASNDRRHWRAISALLTALALTVAFFAMRVDTASATLLCETASCEPREPIGTYPEGTALAAFLQAAAELKTSLGTIACTGSTITGETAAEEGEPLPLEVTALTFNECKLGKSSCTGTTTALPASPSLSAIGKGEGTLSLEGAEVNFTCSFFFNCTFAIPNLQFEGGSLASLGAAEVTVLGEGSICPETSKLSATYTLSEPVPAYAGEIGGSTLLCETASCEPGEPIGTYPKNTALAAFLRAATQAQLMTNVGTVACNSSTIVGETAAEEGEPLPLKITALTFGDCKLGKIACTGTTAALPASPSLKATGKGEGTFSLEGAEVNFTCSSSLNCTYEIPNLQFKGGSPANLGAAEVTVLGKGSICPETSKLSLAYTLFLPAPAYAVESDNPTLLCETASCELSEVGGVYPKNTALAAQGPTNLITNLGSVTCIGSIAGETIAEKGESLPLIITELFFHECKLGKKSCTGTTLTSPASPSLKATGKGEGILNLEGVEANFTCGSSLNCTYEIPNLQFEGGSPASLGVTEVTVLGKGSLCPATSELSATYTLSEPVPAYAGEIGGTTLLCETASCELSKPGGIYPENTALAASLQEGTQLQLLTYLGTVKCKKATIVGETAAEKGEPLPLEISELAIGECKLGGTSCAASTATLPGSPALNALGEGNGVFRLAGGEVYVECGSTIKCTYAAPNLRFEGGGPASLSAEEVVPEYVKGLLCPGSSAFDITYTLTKPTPAYLVIG